MIQINGGQSSGTIVTDEEIELNGWFKGQLQCRVLVVGLDGYLMGAVVSEEVNIAGQIVGRVQAQRVLLSSSAHVEGEIYYKELCISEGATITANLIRTDGERSPSIGPG